MSLFKKERFSIRKICGIVGSVLLGSILVAPSIIHASTYHYVEKSALTQEEQTKIQAGIPTDNEASYALVYQQETLPATGSSTSVLTALGLLAVGSLVLLVHKKKKVTSLFLVTTIGLISLSSMQALDISNPLKAPSNEGVVQITGYRYIGYLPLNDDAISEIQHTDDGPKNVPVSELQSIPNEVPEAEKPEHTAPVGGNLVEPEIHEKPEYTEPLGTVPNEAPKVEKPDYTQPKGANLVEPEVHEKPEYTAPVGMTPEEIPKVEMPDYTQPVGANLVEPAVKPALPEAVVTEKGEPAVQPSLPEAIISEKGDPEVQTALPEAVVTNKGEAEVHEKPDYTQPIGANLVEPEVHEKPEYNAPVGTTPEEAPKSEKPAYTEPVGTTGVDENGNLIEPPVIDIPEYTEPISTVSEVASEREELPSLHTDIRTETISKTTIEESEPTKFIGDDSVKQIGEDGERQIVTSYEELHGKKISEPVETVTILKEMKPEILVKGTKEKPKEKTAPVLTLERTDTNVLDRSANLSYHLVNTDGVKINKITATIKDGNEIVKTVDLTSEQLDKQVEDLKFYKDYKIETTMTYDRGKGEETATLEEKPLRLDLKKVEIKNIASTNLVKVNDDGTETPSDFMTEKPSDEDVKKMYLKITSRDNKITRLAVDKIELVTEKEKELYKITATAQDLIQHVDPSKTRNEYIHYIEKPRPKVDNVYYNFKDLVDAMNADKNGTFKIGADLNAENVPTPNKEYVPGTFRGTLTSVEGNQYSIHNMKRQLFGGIEGGSVKNINLANVNINMPWINDISALAKTVKNATVENIKVTGSILGNNSIAGIVNKIDRGGLLRNVAFIGKLQAVGDRDGNLAGIAGEIWKGNLDRAYADVTITGKRARAAGLVAKSDNGMDNFTVGKEGSVRHSVAKGTIDIDNPVDVGGFISSNWVLGQIEDNVSMVKVSKGEIFYGSRNIDEEGGYFSGNRLENDFVVRDMSTGTSSYQRSKRVKEISLEEANKKIKGYNITASGFEISALPEDTLNRTTPKSEEYKSTQDYKTERDLAYRNIAKLQPFYNKEWIVNQGNKLAEESNLVKKEVLSVTGMKEGQFVTDLSDIDKIMLHYADGTKEEMDVTKNADSKVKQVREYAIAGQNVVYTPNMVEKDRVKLIADVKEKLASVTYDSQDVRKIIGNPADLYLEESFNDVKDNLDKFVKALVENEDHQLNSDEAAMKALVKKVDDNKAKIMMALSYLNRYYNIKYTDNSMSIKDLMIFKPDFYGKTPSVLDRLINIGSSEKNLKGDRTQDAYREIIAGNTGKGSLRNFLEYNMHLFTEDKDINDWFIHSAKNVYVSEPKTTNTELKDKRHRVFDGLDNGVHGRMILPLLNLKKAHMFLISTYNTMAYSSFEKYGKLTEESRNEFKKEIDKVAHAQQTYLDFWSRLALPNVRDRLLKSQNMVPTPVWDNQTYNGSPVGRRGFDSKGNPVAPIRELYGPTWRHHDRDWRMGAMASIFPNPNNDDKVLFMVTDMISPFGISAFTHETTHVNDRMLYFGGHKHRQGTDVEAYAQGMLQTPDKSTSNGEYGALGLNMAYHRENNGDQWYNYDPDKLKTREDIDRYMKNYNEALMMLDYVEADAVIPKLNGDNSKWFKKIDRVDRHVDGLNNLTAPHQWDKVRDLNEGEKTKPLASIDDLVDNNFMTKHNNPGNGVFRPEDFTPNSAYVNVQMMAGIYGGNTSKGAPGSLSFKHNAFRMWGYFGYENGFIGYVSSKYQDEANKQNQGKLGDDFIIKKVSNNQFLNLEDWKKHWYHDVKARAEKGFTEITIDGQTIHNYNELKALFDKAVTEDLKKAGNYSNTENLKSKVFKALLKNTDGFFNQLFTKDI